MENDGTNGRVEERQRKGTYLFTQTQLHGFLARPTDTHPSSSLILFPSRAFRQVFVMVEVVCKVRAGCLSDGVACP